MNSNLQPMIDVHQISLDLDGLDDLLDAVVLDSEVRDVEPGQSAGSSDENQLIVRLLEQVREVNRRVQETSERLVSANERMSSLATMVQMQTGQLELLGHYQTQAAKVTGLERKVALLERENEQLRLTWWRKLVAWAQVKI